MEDFIARIRRSAQGGVSCVCAVFMLCVFPLLFHNAFFDINRFKVNAVCTVIPWMAVAFLLALAIRPRDCLKQTMPTDARAAVWSMAGFVLACVVSSARTGFDAATLTGSEGRYCGLYFILSCAAAFWMIASGTFSRHDIGMAVLCCAGIVAALGILNALGIDPLGFYQKIRKDQEALFLSTIGNTDFFGAYLAMLFPLAGARFVHGGRGKSGGFGLALLMLLGAAASRTDTPFFALQLCCALLFVWAGDAFGRMRRALIVWAACWLSLPVMRLLFETNGKDLSGLMLVLGGWPIAFIPAMACFAAACVCAEMEKRGMHAPGRRRLGAWVGALLCAVGIVLIGVIAYFTLMDTQTDLGELSALLRFDDNWGSRRGFVYVRSIRAYADYSIPDKLFGKGVDLAKRSLTPYFDNPQMLSHGTFNDAHCQPLQVLLTCGLAGLAAFLALYVFTMRALLRRTGEDALLFGLQASLAGYGIIMLVQVTQPILIATYLSLCALALSRIREPKEGAPHEP